MLELFGIFTGLLGVWLFIASITAYAISEVYEN